MKHHEISTALLKYLKSIKPGFTIDSWIYNGVTDVKFGSPGGPWGDDVEGFLFVKQDNSYSFILRCVPNVTRKNGKLTSYIVIESMNLRSQLFNNDLDKGNTVRLEPGRSILLEPYDMTVGAPQKRQVTKEIFAQLNINTDQISVIDDQSPDWGKTLLDLLNWAVLREQVKIKLKKGFNKANMEELTENEMRQKVFPINTILFGPPGTGKTFNTINKALEIIGETDLNWNDRRAVKRRFDDRVKEGRIVFTTFHQSMSYEDFIEGIKPKMDDDIDDDQKKLDYEIKDGIFKRSCAFAAFYCHERYIASKSVTSEYSFDSLYDAFIEWIQEQMDAQKLPVFKTLRGREVEVKNINRNRSIIARAKHSVAISSAPLTKENFEKLYNRFKSVDEIKDLREVQETVQISPRITEFYAVFAGLKEFEQKEFKPDVPMLLESKEVSGFDVEEILKKYNGGVYNDAIKQFSPAVKPVILIIDEINRGNISQIFGELITLIEEDKRLGKNEALEITLPYSKKPFGVPPNLHIIGTMNTADRSVESLDTALRRRFSFEEMPPKPDILTPNLMLWNLLDKYEASEWDEVEYAEKEASVLTLLGAQDMVKGKMKGYWEEYIKNEKKTKPQFLNEWFSGITLQQILQRINLRVEKLLDPDHQIGHSYFMDVSSLEDLQNVFYHKVIPLLQEYFFGDYGKIGLVLGRGFVRKKKWDEKNSDGFAEFGDYENAGDFNDREVFEIVKYHHQPAPEYALKVGESTYKMDFEKAIKILLKLPIE